MIIDWIYRHDCWPRREKTVVEVKTRWERKKTMNCDPEMCKEILRKLKEADEEGGFGIIPKAYYFNPEWSWFRELLICPSEKDMRDTTFSGRALALFIEQVKAANLIRAELLYCRENLGEEAWKKLGIKIPEEPESEFKPYAAVYKEGGYLTGYAVIVTGHNGGDSVKITGIGAFGDGFEYESRLLPIQNLGQFIASLQKHMPEAFQKMKMEKVREYKERVERAYLTNIFVFTDFNRIFAEMEAE